MTSSALFIIVAESTEILRPITQFGCAQASSGVTPCSVAGSRWRNGPPEAVSTMWSMRCAPVAAVLGQALEDRRMLAVDRQQRRAALAHRAHEQRAADHQRLLVGQQQPLAGARRGQAGRQAGRADDGRHHAVHLRVGGQVAQRLRAAAHLGGHAVRAQRVAQPRGAASLGHHGRSAAASAGTARSSSSMRWCALRPDDLEALGVARHHVERAGADRPGGAEDDEPLRPRR